MKERSTVPGFDMGGEYLNDAHAAPSAPSLPPDMAYHPSDAGTIPELPVFGMEHLDRLPVDAPASLGTVFTNDGLVGDT